MQYLTAMLCRIQGEANNTHFKADWIPLAHRVLYVGIVYNWANILLVNIMKTLEKLVTKSEGQG